MWPLCLHTYRKSSPRLDALHSACHVELRVGLPIDRLLYSRRIQANVPITHHRLEGQEIIDSPLQISQELINDWLVESQSRSWRAGCQHSSSFEMSGNARLPPLLSLLLLAISR